MSLAVIIMMNIVIITIIIILAFPTSWRPAQVRRVVG
jgi:hypothetical protein